MFNFTKKSLALSSFLIFSYLFIGCGGGETTDKTNSTDTLISKPKPKNIEEKNIPEPVIIQTPLPINTTGITINEVLSANANINYDPDFKQFSDWIELYNHESHSIDIGGFYLSDDTANPKKYKIPSGTTIASHGYLLIWSDKKNTKSKAIHANFKLSQKGETLTLANKHGDVIDILEFGKQDGDISCVRKDNAIVYMEPTPKRTNSQTYDKLKRSKKPKFSLDSGFYNGTQTIKLTQKNGGVIYYTLDGSTPTKNSTLYTNPISINKTTAIRTRAYEDGKLLSNVKNQTFLIDEDISFPVISLTIDDKHMYGDSGIYTNYEKDWIKPAGIEYIKDGKSQFSENVGVRISGAGSRKKAQKSLSVFVKNKYGPKSLKYSLFPDKPEIKKIKSFLLRTSGGDVRLLMRDALTHELVRENMDIDYQSYHAVVAFINGKYYGVLNIREKLNEDYIKANHGVDKNNLDLIGERNELLRGSDKEYKNLINFVKNNDLSNIKNYNKVINQIDLDEYINYNITEIFVGNWDWPIKNIKYWKDHSATGKWRWMLYDTDDGYGSMRAFSDNTFKFLLDEEYARGSKEAKYLLRGLLKNQAFVDKFVDRFTTHLNLTFKQNRVDKFLNRLKASLVPEIDRHFERWIPYEPRLKDYSVLKWNIKIDKLVKTDDGISRAEHLREYMHTYFGKTGSNLLQVDIATQGQTYIDEIKLAEDFNGEYFNGAKVTLKAIPNEGHSFIKWSNGSTNPEITVTINNDTSISAEFN